MADVFSDLQTETDALVALAERHGYGPGLRPDVTGAFAQLTSSARLVRLSVETPEAFGVTSQITYRSLDEAIVTWLVEQRKANALLAAAGPDRELPWSDGPVRASVVAAAALTEIFACGQDVADALAVTPERGDSVGHVAYYCVRTRDTAYRRQGVRPPATPFRFELTAPSGAGWTFGPAAGRQRVSGPALDLCLVATGRRMAGDTALTSAGNQAREWLYLRR
jgi:uncharacterized protein (TIGR03084 family)